MHILHFTLQTKVIVIFLSVVPLVILVWYLSLWGEKHQVKSLSQKIPALGQLPQSAQLEICRSAFDEQNRKIWWVYILIALAPNLPFDTLGQYKIPLLLLVIILAVIFGSRSRRKLHQRISSLAITRSGGA